MRCQAPALLGSVFVDARCNAISLMPIRLRKMIRPRNTGLPTLQVQRSARCDELARVRASTVSRELSSYSRAAQPFRNRSLVTLDGDIEHARLVRRTFSKWLAQITLIQRAAAF